MSHAESGHYKYLIIGAGMTGDSAVRGIRSVDPGGSVGLIGAEADPPYERPPLSKGLWKGRPLDKIWRKTPQQNVDLHLGRTVLALDLKNRQVTDSRHNRFSFDKLLLATGVTPRQLPFYSERIIYFRTVADYHRLHALCAHGQRFAVIGGGFIGSEIAAALAMNGKEVVMLFPEETLGGRVFPRELGLFLNAYYRARGVQVLAGEAISGIEHSGAQCLIKMTGRQDILVDAVVAGIGSRPNIELAQAAGLAVGNGIVVDEYLCTSDPDIYAAGDVAEFYNPALGKRIRVEHEDNANTMGELAGRNMAGATDAYHHLPSFYSDLFELGYEAVGELDARLETVADWQEPGARGIVYYLQDSRVRGVLLWDTWGQLDAARALIAEPGPFSAASLEGRLSG